jgi:hypothetical protein
MYKNVSYQMKPVLLRRPYSEVFSCKTNKMVTYRPWSTPGSQSACIDPATCILKLAHPNDMRLQFCIARYRHVQHKRDKHCNESSKAECDYSVSHSSSNYSRHWMCPFSNYLPVGTHAFNSTKKMFSRQGIFSTLHICRNNLSNKFELKSESMASHIIRMITL